MQYGLFHLFNGFENGLVDHSTSVPIRRYPVRDSNKMLNITRQALGASDVVHHRADGVSAKN